MLLKRCSLLVAIAVAAVALDGNGRSASLAPWLRVDLVKLDPVGGRPSERDAQWRLATIEPLSGPAVGGDTAPQVSGIRQLAGTDLEWHLRLGEEPYLAFTPIMASNIGCLGTGVVSVAVGPGRWVETWRGAALSPWPEGREVDVALDRWHDQQVRLRFSVEGATRARRCAVFWGSPEVTMRTASVVAHAPHPERPNIVLIGLDTLRADALGAWGRQPSLTPALDALAAESDVFLHAYSTANSTNPSFCSIHTGLYALHHGIHDLRTPLGASHVTLAEALRRRGYETHAILSAHHLGVADLAQRFASALIPERGILSGRLTTDEAIDWLQRPHPQPFFLWLHLFDAHTPHLPPAPFSLGERAAGVFGLARVAAWTPFRALGARPFRDVALGGHFDLYAGEVAFVDREVDRLLGTLAGRGYLGDTIVVVVADHGENLEEHGILYRHVGLWETTTHVPLLVRWPGELRRQRRFGGLVQTIDLMPTLLAATGARLPGLDGRDLRELVSSPNGGRRAVFAEQIDGTGAAVRTARWRYFLSSGSRLVAPGPYLYDLASDPFETRNLAGSGRPEERQLDALLADWRRQVVRVRPGAVSEEEDRALHALGYD